MQRLVGTRFIRESDSLPGLEPMDQRRKPPRRIQRPHGGTSAGGPFGAARIRSSLTYVCPVDKRVTRILGAPATLGLRDGLAFCGSVGARWLRLVWDPM